MRKIRTIIAIFCILCLIFSFGGCKTQASPHEKTVFNYFDTISTIYSYAGDSEEDFAANCRRIETLLEKYHRLFDIYNEYEGINNLYTVNQNAGGEPIAVDRELIDFLLYAKWLCEVTNGEMNVMMGSVLSLWHDCRAQVAENASDAVLPTKSMLLFAAEHTSIDLLEIDEEKGTVRISDPLASIDVGAVGKGYATELVAQGLKAKGVDAYVLDVGGNLRIIGRKPDGGTWVTGIKNPFDSHHFAEKLKIADTSCVTSGDYERYFELDGRRYHHIIDKDTLYPAEHFSSVTVVCENSGLADALSTALFCMSFDEGRALVERLEDVEVIWITKEGEKLCTEGIAEMRSE